MGNVKNPVMGIWLGKNELNQTDRAEISGKDGAPMIPPVSAYIIIYHDNR